MSERHNRDFFFIAKTGELRGSIAAPPAVGITRTATANQNSRIATSAEAKRLFRFSEIVETKISPPDEALLEAVAEIMTKNVPDIDSHIPAGYTYLGQFIDHDLTRDVTKNLPLGSPVATPDELEQGRSPALDLDSLYGAGPVANPEFYQADGIKLKVGKTKASGTGASPDARDLDGFDLPRLGSQAVEPQDFRKAQIPDQRNDENLAIAQTHLAFVRFHNKVSEQLASRGVPSAILFERARELVTKHYQWMLVKDYLPRIVDSAVVNDVFTSGRLIFEPGASGFPTMPLEFSVGAFRLGHSMIREKYEWNAFFGSNGIIGDFATLFTLFTFSGTSGNLSPGTDPDNPLEGNFERLPTNWIADWPLLFDFVEAGIPELAPVTFLNLARPIDIRLTDPLKQLPLGSFGARNPSVPPLPPTDKRRNLAFRNLVRARMVNLATGQELVSKINEAMTAAGRSAEAITPLSRQQILGTEFTSLSPQQQDDLANHTPLWFYILREASLNKINGRDGTGRLGKVGGRIVAEVFHRAIEASRISFLRDREFTPTLGRTQGVFRMADLLLVAYDATKGELRPLSPSAPRPGGQSLPTGDALLVVRNLSLKTPNLVGSDVSALQAALNRQGLRLTVDGVFGPLTRTAVVKWQTDRGHMADGVVGIQTRSSLGLQRLIRLQDPRQRGDDVRAIQSVLERKAQVRLQETDGSFDGIFGPFTASAVRKFQSISGLLVDGVVGRLTLRSLGLIS
jgi:peptidoglycan hydrolase-like protein with peptidoglycan-binding domain